jgi:hypothetical protein
VLHAAIFIPLMLSCVDDAEDKAGVEKNWQGKTGTYRACDTIVAVAVSDGLTPFSHSVWLEAYVLFLLFFLGLLTFFIAVVLWGGSLFAQEILLQGAGQRFDLACPCGSRRITAFLPLLDRSQLYRRRSRHW